MFNLDFKAALKELVETVVFVIVMVIAIRFFVAEIRWIPSASMHPTLIEGDRVVVERMSRFFTKALRDLGLLDFDEYIVHTHCGHRNLFHPNALTGLFLY